MQTIGYAEDVGTDGAAGRAEDGRTTATGSVPHAAGSFDPVSYSTRVPDGRALAALPAVVAVAGVLIGSAVAALVGLL